MKGLLFSEPMVKAWLAGNKTVTRRLMNPQPFDVSFSAVYPNDERVHYFIRPPSIKPRYLPGETVYIKETWRCDDPAAAQDIMSPGIGLFYKAGMSEEEYAIMPRDWKSPRFMPEWASRSHARIVSVMPERVQEITPEGAISEGLAKITKDNGRTWKYGIPDRDGFPGTDDSGWPWEWWRMSPVDAYERLWESLHPGSWKCNDWVWRIELEKKP